MMNRWQRIRKAKSMGCRMPYRAYRAGNREHVPFWVICAFLEQETDGGQNIFGQDASIFSRAGVVTKEKYLRYKALRKRTGQSQGVGPMQLTYSGYQDWADAEGGCWRPTINIRVGARILRGFWDDEKSWYSVALKYNGSTSYANQLWPILQKWRNAFEGQ